MNPQIPKVILDGTLFGLDHQNKTFLQIAEPENTIPFSAVKENSGKLFLQYDTYSKCSADDPRSYRSHPKKDILIPRQILESPELLLDSEGYCKKHNQQSYLHKYHILLLDDEISNRLNGQLPVIDLAGYPFFVDLRMQAIRPKDDFSQILNFREMYLHKKDGFQFFYKPETHELVDLKDDQLISYPPGLVAVHLPSPKVMDPISYARLNFQEETSLLPKYPQQQHLVADIKPLSRNWLASQIKINKAKRAELEAQNSKPKQTKRNSNRIR